MVLRCALFLCFLIDEKKSSALGRKSSGRGNKADVDGATTGNEVWGEA